MVALRLSDGTAADLPGDAANGLDVDVTRLPAIALDTATLAALENITVTVANPGSGQATETTLAAVLAAVDGLEGGIAPLATQVTATAILAKLSSDPSTATAQATQATKLDTLHTDLAAVLAKLITAPATEATLVTVRDAIGSIGGIDTSALSTETTQANVLTNVQSLLVAAQNTLTALTGTVHVDSASLGLQLDTLNASLTAILAVDGTRATSAKQDTAQATLSSLLSAQGATGDASSASTLVGLLKAIKASVAGTVAIAGPVSLSAALPAGTNAIGSVARTPLSASATARVASSVTAVTLQATNASRRALKLYNESTAILYIKDGSAATITDYSTQVGAGGYYEWPVPIYQGIVTGLWVTANGAAQITEGT